MSFGAIDHLLLRLRFHPSSANPCPSRRLHSLPFFSHRPPISSRRPVFGRVYSTSPLPRKSINNPFVSELLVLLAFSALLLCLRVFSNIILPDFTGRWRELAAFAAEAEVRTSSYPWHVWQAIVAYEDQRFFRHLGIDPVGTARAVMSFSALGGGSTITQQLVKNTFLKNERTLPRKIVEMVLALALERTMSKRRILSCYVNKIYWGHGIYDIKSASIFYFGKHPSLLSLGESAMLAGIIPAPELRSPLKDLSRGKTFQVRVLRRMVEVGSLDIETALLVMKQSIQLRVEMSKFADMLLHPLAFSNEKLDASNKLEQVTATTLKDIWDWEKESRAREACEDMERWAIKVRLIDHGTSAKHSGCSEKRMFPR